MGRVRVRKVVMLRRTATGSCVNIYVENDLFVTQRLYRVHTFNGPDVLSIHIAHDSSLISSGTFSSARHIYGARVRDVWTLVARMCAMCGVPVARFLCLLNTPYSKTLSLRSLVKRTQVT
jgi:hypothetical protein